MTPLQTRKAEKVIQDSLFFTYKYYELLPPDDKDKCLALDTIYLLRELLQEMKENKNVIR